KGRSYVIGVTVRTGSAQKSAEIANALSEAYIRDQLAAKNDATSRASDWLKQRIADLKGQSATADAAVERYLAEQSVGEGQGAAVTTQQLAEINTQLVSARAARAEAEARHDQISRLISAKGESAAANVLSSPLILSLRQQRAEVRRREAELATRYGPKHPQMINVKAELRDIGSAIAVELRKRVAALANDAEVARAREAALLAALSDVEDRSVDLSRASVGLRQLEREAEASRRIYEDVLARYKETTEQQNIQQPDARVISAASPAAAPAAPRRGLISGLAATAGVLLGFGFVFLGEVTANTFRTAAEAERALGVCVIAKLPLARRGRRRARLLKALADQPNSPLAEAARGLRNALLTSDGPTQVIMATSAAPDEGKSSTCLALAQMSALMGRTAIVVECDFRRPSIAEALGGAGPLSPDLFDVLKGDASVDEARREIGTGDAWALSLRAPAPEAADLLSSQRFRALIDGLRARYDLVLLDTPPALAVSDAAAVAAAADKVLMLVRWHHTARQAAEACVRRLTEVDAPLVGVVLTMVDPAKEAAFEYSGYRKGAPDYGAYYATG
ncbi:MAG: GNVR domain-containing protein, partial [Pseudomonadota bacterium]